MIEQKWFPIVYMFIVTCFFSSIVIGFSMFSSQRVEANAKLSFEKAVISVFPGLYDENLGNVELHQKFTDNVTAADKSGGGTLMLKKNGQIEAYALPMSGQGFWAPIKAVIGIGGDKKTITGIAIYQQNETPGLGAEISKISFRQQFKGIVISEKEKAINIKRPGDTLGKSDVHAVTGATQTSVRLEKIINDALKKWQKDVSK